MTRPLSVHDARDIAQVLLSGLPGRWRHTIGVARRAEELAATLDAHDGDHLLCAAWLHDIGYADDIADTGFHPLDGARFLDRQLWPRRVNALVAHHSGAAFIAAAHGLDEALRRYPREESAVTDALTYADQTTGPNGERMSIEQRLAETLRRHGPDSAQARVHHRRVPYLLAAAERVEQRVTTYRAPASRP